MDDDELWYVAFGSNMYLPRFLKYVPEWPAAKVGAYDLRRFSLDTTVPHELYFAGASAKWDDSSVAFVSTDAGATTYCRAYRVTPGELCRVISGENGIGRMSWHPEMLPRAIGDFVELDLPDGDDPRRAKYNALLRVIGIDGIPAVTLTTTRRLPRNKPSQRYLDALTAGLSSTSHHDVSGPYLNDALSRSEPLGV